MPLLTNRGGHKNLLSSKPSLNENYERTCKTCSKCNSNMLKENSKLILDNRESRTKYICSNRACDNVIFLTERNKF